MADTEQTGNADASPETEEVLQEPRGGSSLLLILLYAGIAVTAAAAGFGTALLFGSSSSPEQPADPTVAQAEADPAKRPPDQEFTYWDIETITVNLDEPRLARHITVSLKLAVRTEDYSKAMPSLEKRKPELKSWLTVYFASCALDEVRGAMNLNRMRREILDAFNNQLWPDQKPLISHVLFEKIAVS